MFFLAGILWRWAAARIACANGRVSPAKRLEDKTAIDADRELTKFAYHGETSVNAIAFSLKCTSVKRTSQDSRKQRGKPGVRDVNR